MVQSTSNVTQMVDLTTLLGAVPKVAQYDRNSPAWDRYMRTIAAHVANGATRSDIEKMAVGHRSVWSDFTAWSLTA